MSYERNTCRLCGGKVETVLSLKPTPIANSFPDKPNEGHFYPLDLKQCQACAHVQIGYVIDDAVLYGKHYKYSTPGALKPYLEARAKDLRKQYPSATSLLEIGANNGMFLHSLRDAGFSPVIGIDPSAKDPLVWSMPFGKKSASLIFDRIGAVDMIVANNVFAHIDDLDEVFCAINSILSFEGVLVFEVQYLSAMIASGAFDMIYHEHRDYHTLRPLQRFLQKHDMILVKYDLVPLHGGSIRVFAKRYGKECPLPGEPTHWGRFQKAIEDAKESVAHAIGERRVIGFGATAKACTLIHNLGISQHIAYMVDSTPEKQGRYIPGTSIEIRPETSLMDSDMPLFLTAWNYADYIREKYPNREIIVPFEKKVRLAA